ncbi:hypothetical protein SVAN01_07381 [Stagonosporopsis vannaccii]|nr:hypothetical protein SVAN01_07381 [Stagonosporopsis vannaccii]
MGAGARGLATNNNGTLGGEWVGVVGWRANPGRGAETVLGQRAPQASERWECGGIRPPRTTRPALPALQSVEAGLEENAEAPEPARQHHPSPAPADAALAQHTQTQRLQQISSRAAPEARPTARCSCSCTSPRRALAATGDRPAALARRGWSARRPEGAGAVATRK